MSMKHIKYTYLLLLAPKNSKLLLVPFSQILLKAMVEPSINLIKEGKALHYSLKKYGLR